MLPGARLTRRATKLYCRLHRGACRGAWVVRLLDWTGRSTHAPFHPNGTTDYTAAHAAARESKWQVGEGMFSCSKSVQNKVNKEIMITQTEFAVKITKVPMSPARKKFETILLTKLRFMRFVVLVSVSAGWSNTSGCVIPSVTAVLPSQYAARTCLCLSPSDSQSHPTPSSKTHLADPSIPHLGISFSSVRLPILRLPSAILESSFCVSTQNVILPSRGNAWIGGHRWWTSRRPPRCCPQLFDTLAFFNRSSCSSFPWQSQCPFMALVQHPTAFVLAPTKWLPRLQGTTPSTHVPNLYSASPGTHQESSCRSACTAAWLVLIPSTWSRWFRASSKEKLMHNKAVRNLFLVETCGDSGYTLMLKSGKAAPARNEQNQGRVAWRDPAEWCCCRRGCFGYRATDLILWISAVFIDRQHWMRGWWGWRWESDEGGTLMWMWWNYF